MTARLTDVDARNARQGVKPYKLYDGNGLYLLVKVNGTRAWRYRYRIGGAENLFALGNYPQIGLKQARKFRDRARLLVEQGIHPARQKKADRLLATLSAANTFERVAREWIDQHRGEWSPYYLRQVENMLKGDVFPHIGALPIRSVHASHLLAIINKITARDAATVAMLVRQWCSAIFRYAVATLRADTDPSAALKGAIKRRRVQHKKTLGTIELRELFKLLKAGESPTHVRCALQLLLLTFVRPCEVRGATWSEFDLERGEWQIPKERMKMGQAHLVPLSEQALEVLAELRTLDAGRPHVFPNVRDPKRVMSPTTMNRSLERMGYNGKFSAHGFRATASTILNEKGYRPDVIERQLAHGERNKIRASYNHAMYMVERRKMMQEWANLVTSEIEIQSSD